MAEEGSTFIDTVIVQPLIELGKTILGSGPRVLHALIVLILGHFAAAVLRRLTTHGLRAFGIDVIYRRLSNGKAPDSNVIRGPSDLGGSVVYWTIMVSAILYALQILGVDEARGLMEQLLAYLPKILVSIALVAIGLYAADFIGRIVTATAASAQLPAPRWWGLGVQYATVGFTAVAVLDYLQIAADSVLLVLGIVISVVPVAATLAFGLGGRRQAGDLLSGRALKGHLAEGDTILFQHRGSALEGMVEELSPTLVRVRAGESVYLIPYSILNRQVTVIRNGQSASQTEERLDAETS